MPNSIQNQAFRCDVKTTDCPRDVLFPGGAPDADGAPLQHVVPAGWGRSLRDALYGHGAPVRGDARHVDAVLDLADYLYLRAIDYQRFVRDFDFCCP